MKDHFHQNSRKITYGLPLALMAVLGGLLYFLGDPPGVLFMKLTTVPLYLLAVRGASLLFPLSEGAPLDRHYWERQFVDALLFACFLTVALWQPDKSFGGMAASFLVTIPTYAALMGFGLAGFARLAKREAP